MGLQSATTFPVTGVPSGWGASAGAADKNGAYQQVIIGSAGAVEMRVYLFSAKPLDPARINALAEAQYRTLNGG
ncbi:MAG: hypothetical protein JO148_05500 [Acidimicrobiia bacterium]|nr:hypothetical protein [Acidimicrobiia bacterium]